MKDLSAFDTAIADARAFVRDKQRGDWHSVACVVQTASGRQFIGMNLDSTLPRASVCAEPVALGMAMAQDPDDRGGVCAAVNRRGEGIPPCGPCRELMLDYAADAQIAVPDGVGHAVVHMSALMPTPFKPTQRKP